MRVNTNYMMNINPQKIQIVNIHITNITMNDTIKIILKFINDSMEYFQIFTPNADIIVKSYICKEYRDILNSADLLIPDGMPLIWASKLLGTPLKEKVSGSSLFFKICEIAKHKKIKIFLLGGLPGAAEKATYRINKKYGDIISGYYCPKYGFEKDSDEIDKIIKLLKDSNSDILVVGFGAPKQEYFIFKYRDYYKIPVSIALGGTIDFAAGVKIMAPEFLKKNGLGWLWRLAHEPKRLWKRYLVDDIKFFIYIIYQKLGIKGYSD